MSGQEYNALKNDVNIVYNNRGFRANIVNSLMTSSGVNNSSYLRSKGVVSKSTPWFVIGLRDDFERNQFYAKKQRDSLLGNSYQFFEWEAFVSNPDSSKNTFRLGYTERENFGAENNGLLSATKGKSLSLALGLVKIVEQHLPIQRPTEF